MIYKCMAFFVLIWFFGVYLGKQFFQRKKGIQTNQIGKGEKEKSVRVIEKIMGCATSSIIVVQIVSIIMGFHMLPSWARICGFVIGIIGDLFFTLAVVTMKDSWRAGIPEQDKTAFVDRGIYGISRNPAFVGFDLMYIGVLLLFSSYILTIFSICCMVMLHLQILQEEHYLDKAFGDEYQQYKKKVNRYIGRK